MFFLLPIWLGASMGLGLGMLAFQSRHPQHPGTSTPGQQGLQPGKGDLLVNCEILIDEEGEEQLLLATEEIPLDNRQGSHNMVSEHEFSRSAKVELDLSRNHEVEGGFSADLWKIVQNKASLAVSKRWGIKVGSEIKRRVTLRFTVGAGCMVCHHIRWKQNLRRGVFRIAHPHGTLKLPYMVSYGLSHEVVTVAADPHNGQSCVMQLPQKSEQETQTV
ncbi:MAG: hypothetical protein H7833_09905 [Magnetococcus sp. DMHC-1]|nr:hypothetical protein [Magnetococcales bacterium]